MIILIQTFACSNAVIRKISLIRNLLSGRLPSIFSNRYILSWSYSPYFKIWIPQYTNVSVNNVSTLLNITYNTILMRMLCITLFFNAITYSPHRLQIFRFLRVPFYFLTYSTNMNHNCIIHFVNLLFPYIFKDLFSTIYLLWITCKQIQNLKFNWC